MPISKNIPMALNKSSDERLLKLNEMTEAKNVTVSTDSDGNGFVLKNAKGNAPIPAKSGSQITQDQAEGSFEVLGSCVDGEANTLYFIVYDTVNTNHGVYRIDFNGSTLEYEKVVVNRYLFDTKPEFVDMDIIRADVNQAGTITPILYMTDNVSEPKKINVDRAIAADHAVNDDIKEFLSVAKTKPVHEFDIFQKKDDNFKGNFIYGKSLSFAVQWVYQDGERSALSNISDAVVSQAAIRLEEDGSRKDEINYYEISIPKGTTEVKEINVYYRDNETGLMYLADRLDRDADLERAVGSVKTTIYDESAATYRFYGDRDQEPAPLIETNKLYDNVPLAAKTQCIADGRLMYGNYTEGRSLPDVEVELEAVYEEELSDDHYVVNATASFDRVFGVSTQCQAVANLDFSGLPTTVPAGTTISVDFTFFSESPVFLLQEDSNEYIFQFDYLSTTYILGNAQAYRPEFEEMPDIRFRRSYSVPTNANRTTVLNNLATDLRFARSEVKYRNSTNAGVTAKESGALDTINNVILKEVDLTFKLETTQTGGDTVRADLLFDSAVDSSIVITVGNGSTSNASARNGGGQGNSDKVFGGALTNVADTSHEVRSKTLIIAADTNEFKSFKRGANHTFGMVFYDEKGRSSFVKEVGSVFVDTKNSQDSSSARGKAKVNIKFPQINESNQTLPSWVSKYQVVYGGSDIDTFKQYSVSGGFAHYWSYSDFDSNESKEDATKNIYLSLKGWSGSKSSYTGENGADYVYNPKEGDMLRVVHYDIADGDDTVTRFYPENLEFPVVGKTTLRKDVFTDDINLIRAEQEFEQSRDDAKKSRREKRKEKRERKGKKGPGLLTRIGKGFDKLGEKIDEVQEENPFLDRLITTRREKREDLEDAAEDATNKMKDVPMSARNAVYPGGQPTYDSNGNPSGQTDVPFAKGEFLIIKDKGVKNWDRAAADKVQFNDSDGIIESVADNVASDGGPNSKHWYTILNWARNVVVEVYTPQGTTSERVYNELPQVFSYSSNLPTVGHTLTSGDVWQKRVPVKLQKKKSDDSNNLVSHYFRYWDIDGMDYTNMFLESEDASHFFPSDGAVFGRSHFVNKYAAENHRRHSITYSDKYSSDSPFLNLSNFNLSRANFVDLDSSYGGVDRLFSNDGFISCIQTDKASRLPLGQMNVQIGNQDTLTTADNIVGKPSYYAGNYGTRGKTQMSVMKDGNVFFTDLTSKKVLQITGNGISAISDAGMDSFFQDKIESWDALTTKSRVFMGYDPDYNELLVAINSIGAFTGFVASYNVGMKRWTSLYDFSDASGDEPTLFAHVGNRLISCLYTASGENNNEEFLFFDHKEDATKAKYYGDQKSSVVEIIANENPSLVKVFESLSLESNYDNWSAAITASDQNTTIASSEWAKKERGYYAMMPRDISSSSTSHKIGVPFTVLLDTNSSSNTIQLSGAINRLGLPTGTNIYNATKDEYVTLDGQPDGTKFVTSAMGTGLALKAQIVGTTGQNFTTSSVVEAGDKLYLVADQKTNGDAIRDYFCKIKLTSDSSTDKDIELYAINTHYDRSKLGQEKGQ